MKKLLCMLIVAMATPLFSGCYGKGGSASPPPWLPPTAGDGRVKLEWIPSPGVDYWLFTATDPSLTAFNWTGLPNAHAYISAATPFYMCGMFNNMAYYFATNGRTDGGPGGPSSPTISATPYNASSNWAASSTGSTPSLYGVGYTSLTTCSNNATSATGSFAAVGQGGAIFTSSDGKTWNNPASPISTDLFAVTGYAANQNNPANPALRWVAVGVGGASVYSTDGSNWYVGTSTTTIQPLRSITQVAGTFFAVGDAGTILSSTDGNIWIAHTSGTTSNLNGVTHGNIYVAVGNNGTILTSPDGNTWKPQTSGTTSNLRQVTSFVSIYGSIYVAVGDAGAIVTSKDNGATWSAQILGTMSLVGIAAESQYVAGAVADPLLGFIANAQFVAVDSTGNAYTSTNGLTWSPAISTGISLSNLGQPLVSSGFGYVAVSNSGATAYAF